MRLLKMGMQGTDVMELQALLRKLGYQLEVSGVFDALTEEKVKKFQALFGLREDGIVGPNTYRYLERFLLGYDIYISQKGDRIEELAAAYKTSPQTIRIANPGVADRIPERTRLIIPYSTDVVDTNINYDYTVLQHDLLGLKARYPFLEIGTIGNSVLGRNLYYVKLGTGPNVVMFNAAHHSLEWITTVVLMKFIEDFAKAYAFGEPLDSYDPRTVWNEVTMYIIPMVNSDGVDLVLNGLKRDNPYYDDLLVWNQGSMDFSKTWQANNRGVDLNHNYEADWQLAKDMEASYGVTGPGPTRFGGFYPESEPEVQAMVAFTRKLQPSLVLAYHSQGKLIYWNYDDWNNARARTIARLLAFVSGYFVDETTGIASYSGYKDWFIKEFGRPGYTIEVGKGKNPLPIAQFPEIYEANLPLLLKAATVTDVSNIMI